jgi:hypothetical protein
MAEVTIKVALAGAAPQPLELRLLVENLLIRHAEVAQLPWRVVGTKFLPDVDEYERGYAAGAEDARDDDSYA